MAIEIPVPLVEFILLGPADDRRQLQDSPILGDVWIEFGKSPAKALDLLISPYKTQHAGEVAFKIDEGLGGNADDNSAPGKKDRGPEVAYLQGLVVARLSFEQLLSVVIPKTKWWIDRWTESSPTSPPKTRDALTADDFTHEARQQYVSDRGARFKNDVMTKILQSAKLWHEKDDTRQTLELAPLDRFAALAALLLWAGRPGTNIKAVTEATEPIGKILETLKTQLELDRAAGWMTAVAEKMLKDETWKAVKFKDEKPLVWSISRNRAALPAIARSVPAVKADAATTLFKVDCGDIAWAVLDSGIDGDHPAFGTADGLICRIVRSFDFKHFRKIVSLSNGRESRRKANAEFLIDPTRGEPLVNPPDNPQQAEAFLEQLAEDAKSRAPIHWELVQRFVEIKRGAKPPTNHGTHVAGIIGANAQAAKARNITGFDGMCPNISLFDFRVLGPNLQDTEFAIIAALQFIRHLNDSDNFLTIHGANLSLSIPHDVRNFACGRTPICNECERLIDSGVVVVAAAGNHGYKSYETKEGAFESYAAFSITDPGNADGVITVGATHRYWPHTYGVSFFSSRGPTGDGRLKPDLVAPGERIRAPFPGESWGELDGTSMAAPHVSGAAAMLLARYSELIGRPRRVKQILCDTATDLGRERSFQGRGMLDVLRAFQSI